MLIAVIDDIYVREWIYALEAAILLGSIEKDGLTLDATVVSDGEDDEEYDYGADGAEAEEVEVIEEDEDSYEEASQRDRHPDESEKSEEEYESVTEEESSEKQEELMNSTEKIVLEEMRREIMRMEQQKQQGNSEADNIDYTTVSDGELLKFLRARRYCSFRVFQSNLLIALRLAWLLPMLSLS